MNLRINDELDDNEPKYCENFDDHDWIDGYYGLYCRHCDMMIPYGCEPWLPIDDDDIDYEYEYGDY
jgi:hypothetical protein